jgi:hypothetical protein
MTATYPTYPPVQPPRQNHTKMAVAVVAGLATLALFVLAIVGLHSQGANPPSIPAQPTTTQADPDATDVTGYMQALARNGISPMNPTGVNELITVGTTTCTHLRNGSTALQEVDVVYAQASSVLGHDGAIALVDDAIAFLCHDVHDSVPMPH